MCVVNGCIFMTDAARQRDREGRAPQSRPRAASTDRSTFQCRRAIGAGLLHFAATSLSLLGTSPAAETAGPAQRSQTSIHRQASTEPDSARSSLGGGEGIVHQRSGQPSFARAATARARAWVSREQAVNDADPILSVTPVAF